MLVGVALRPFEGAKQALPNPYRIRKRFQDRDVRRPMILAEEAVVGARCEYEIVETNVGRVHNHYRAVDGIDGDYLSHDDGDVLLQPVTYVADSSAANSARCRTRSARL